MRADLKNQEYFTRFIEQNEDDIVYYQESLEEGSVKADRIPAVKRQLFILSLTTLIGKYSSGIPIAELEVDFIEVITFFENGWEDDGNPPSNAFRFDNYVLVIWMLSIAFLLDINDSEFDRIIKKIDNTNKQDYLFDFIIKSKVSSRAITDNMMYPNDYGFLKDLIENKDIETLRNYLDKKWYNSMSQTFWYGTDKLKADTYFGYWSFESGAVAKILKLDDTILKDEQYYPYDLVHWKD